mmetsp:Transcript_22290/g.34928  ORF Transcript_22290/g.34928 Transcript_22290/m.34928 type:complete len:100 (+) Transcript_22290:67-366(+)
MDHRPPSTPSRLEIDDRHILSALGRKESCIMCVSQPVSQTQLFRKEEESERAEGRPALFFNKIKVLCPWGTDVCDNLSQKHSSSKVPTYSATHIHFDAG